MSRVRITTPVPDHTGVVGNVYIRDGVAVADTEEHAAEIAYCRRNGYTVEHLEDEPAVEGSALEEAEAESADGPDVTEEAGAPPRRNGPTEAWRAYAIAHGVPADEANALTRDQLVERFTSTEETE